MIHGVVREDAEYGRSSKENDLNHKREREAGQLSADLAYCYTSQAKSVDCVLGGGISPRGKYQSSMALSSSPAGMEMERTSVSLAGEYVGDDRLEDNAAASRACFKLARFCKCPILMPLSGESATVVESVEPLK